MTDVSDARARLKAATAEREALRRRWDGLRNRELLALAVLSATRMTQAERCGIFLASPDGAEVWLEAGTDVIERQIRVRQDNSMVGEVLRTGAALIREGLTEQDGAHLEVGGETRFVARDALSVPIRDVAGSAVLGVLQVLNREPGSSFGEEDIKVLEEVAFLLQETVQRIHAEQDLLDAAGALDRRIEQLDRRESALRGDGVLRTFAPAVAMAGGGFLHH
ncbi:MAG: GAF domain-containing protein, partial [Planctomycetota bacterium]|nr:GAF domain-containing protein [Planctomycetota bacterium]